MALKMLTIESAVLLNLKSKISKNNWYYITGGYNKPRLKNL